VSAAGTIAGVVVSLVMFSFIVCLIYWCLRRRRMRYGYAGWWGPSAPVTAVVYQQQPAVAYYQPPQPQAVYQQGYQQNNNMPLSQQGQPYFGQTAS